LRRPGLGRPTAGAALRRWMHAPRKRTDGHFLGLNRVPPARAIPVRPDIRIALQEALPMSVVSVTAPLTGRVP
jgi:hypothetical protein